MQQAWDYLEFRWDRYVISYGFYDQARAFFGLRSLWINLRRMLFGRELRPEVSQPAEPEMAPKPDPESVPPVDGPTFPAWMPLLAVLVAAGIWWRFGRRELTATRAYRQLRRRLHFMIFQDIEVWAINAQSLPRLPFFGCDDVTEDELGAPAADASRGVVTPPSPRRALPRTRFARARPVPRAPPPRRGRRSRSRSRYRTAPPAS